MFAALSQVNLREAAAFPGNKRGSPLVYSPAGFEREGRCRFSSGADICRVWRGGLRVATVFLSWVDGLMGGLPSPLRSEEHTSELQSLMRISYAVFCLKKKK